jgi:hypothetical protein
VQVKLELLGRTKLKENERFGRLKANILGMNLLYF